MLDAAPCVRNGRDTRFHRPASQLEKKYPSPNNDELANKCTDRLPSLALTHCLPARSHTTRGKECALDSPGISERRRVYGFYIAFEINSTETSREKLSSLLGLASFARALPRHFRGRIALKDGMIFVHKGVKKGLHVSFWVLSSL